MYAGAEQRAIEDTQTTTATVSVAVLAAAASGFIVFAATQQIIAGLGAAVAGGMIVGTLASAEVGIYAVLAASFFDGLFKGMSPGWHSLLAKDVFLALTIARWLWDGMMGYHKFRSLRSLVALPAFLFIVYCGAQMFNTETASLRAALAGFRTWVLWIPLFFVAYDSLRRPTQVRRFILVVALLTLITSAYGIVQFRIGFGHLEKLGPGFGFYVRFGGGEHVRATSTLVNPGVFGAAAVLSALICLGGIGFIQRPQWLRSFLAIVAAVSIIGMASSGSRAPLLALLVAGLAFIVLVRKPQLVILIAVVGLIMMGLAGEFAPDVFAQRYTAERLGGKEIIGRVSMPFIKALTIVTRTPLGTGVASGVGVGRGAGLVAEPVRVRQTAAGMIENEYGRALRELGIPGGLLFVFLLYRVLRGALTSYSSLIFARDRWMAGGLIGVLISVLAELMVGSVLYLAPSGPFFYLAGGLCERLAIMEGLSPSAAQQEAGLEAAMRQTSAPLKPQPH